MEMKFQVIHGGVNLVDKDAELEKAKEATERELLIQQRQEEERLRRQKELEAQAEAKKKEFSSIEVRDMWTLCTTLSFFSDFFLFIYIDSCFINSRS